MSAAFSAGVSHPLRAKDMSVRHLRPMGDLGQIVPMKFDPYDYDSIKASMEHCNVVVNLTGKHFETMHWTYKNVHCDLPVPPAESRNRLLPREATACGGEQNACPSRRRWRWPRRS